MKLECEIKNRYTRGFTVGKPLVDIKPIGYGGAFATHEGHSSFLVSDMVSKKNLLIDCGSLVYRKLRETFLSDQIDAVYITHTHEDHIGSLSSLIYENWFVHKRKLAIFCHNNVRHILTKYLITVCNHDYNQFDMPPYREELLENLFPSFSLSDFNTTSFHFPDFPTAGLILDIKNKEEVFKVVFSGDLGVPVWDVIGEKGDLIFQDAGTYKFTEGHHLAVPHAYYEDCDRENVYLYHHFKEEVDVINKNCNHARSISDMIKEGDSFQIQIKEK